MNAITYAIDRIIKYAIPKPILNMTFVSRYYHDYQTLDTLESRIREEIIDGRVAVDLNLLHATEMTIPLARCTRLDTTSYYTTIWRVPKELTQGKRITSPLELTAASGSTITANASQGGVSGGLYTPNLTAFSNTGAGIGAARQMMNSVTPIPSTSNALLYMVGDNTILIKDAVIVPSTMVLRVNVENDENLSHITPPYFPTFYELVTAAAKAYIFNNLIIEQDNVFILSGGELNRFKEVVEGYADAEEIYSEKLEAWYQSGLLMDGESQRRFYQMISGGGY